MEDLVDARLDHARLDDPGAAVRVRLQATVTQIRHLGPPASAKEVELHYVDRQGQSRAVRSRQVLLACWHRVIAHLTDELPLAQRRALDDQVKTPLLYATVLVSNWQPWQRAGVRSIKAPGGFWAEAELDFPVSMGSVRFPQSADEPMLLHLSKVVVPGDGRSPRLQAAAGRRQLMRWSFEFLEGELRGFLQGALGDFGFDHGRDIEAITVNRWGHGYSLEYARPWDRFWPAGPLPCDVARRGWGRVAIANADSGAYAYAHSAIDQAARAVQELLPQAVLPRWNAFPGPDPAALGLGRR
jgi:spermidine dehydrogenase